MKTDVTFTGRVEHVGDEMATVLLIESNSNESVESCCDLGFLKKHKLSKGDEFILEIIGANGLNVEKVTRLQPKTITAKQMHQFRKSVAHLDEI